MEMSPLLDDPEGLGMLAPLLRHAEGLTHQIVPPTGVAAPLVPAAEEGMLHPDPFFRGVTKHVLEVAPETKELWFHGSRATGNEKPNSDWDFLAVMPNEVGADRYLDLAKLGAFKDSIQGRTVDIDPAKDSDRQSYVSPLYWADTEGEGQKIWPYAAK